MDKQRVLISLFFGLILLIGTGLSSSHFHIDNYSDSETVHQLVEDDFQCVICGSVFKFSPQTGIESEVIVSSTPVRFVHNSISYTSVTYPSYDGRAPPVTF
ncbi:hypothetical protein [Rhodohalobacter halophilus]|uniref:hypothetical protein n=1 Tax=Rhodohalobacter halophilus TaxID=1812810 RepID=UPI00114D3638|nr:hypothetical protein [Rhodohalobacter halophilus]